MTNEGSYVALAEGMEGITRPGGQAFWRTLVRGGPEGNSAGRNRLLLLVGTSHGDHDAMLPCWGWEIGFIPVRCRFISNPTSPSRHSFAPQVRHHGKP